MLPVERVPAAAAGVARAVGKEEVVEDELIEMLSHKGADILQPRDHLFVVVAEGVEKPLLRLVAFGRIDGGGQAAGHLHPVLLKGFPAELHMILVGRQAAAEGLQVDFVHPHVFLEKGEVFFQLFLLRPRGAVGDKIVNQLKVPVVSHDGCLQLIDFQGVAEGIVS